MELMLSVRIVIKSVWSNPGNRGQRLIRAAKAIGWQLWKRIIRRPRTIKIANGRKFIAHSDCVVSSALIYAEWPEFHELQFVRSLLKPQDIVIDIGANVGHIGLLLSDIVNPKNIVAFEPTPVTYTRLKQNWLLNCFPTENLFNIAVGESAKIVKFPNLSHPGTMNAQVAGDSVKSEICEIELRTLDSFENIWLDGEIGLLKIDVEGFELDVFRGAVQTLKNNRPRLVMFESLEGQVNPEIAAILEECSYHLFQLDDQGRPDLHSSSAQNVFAAPREIMTSLAKGS